jgi:hypothetical protein
LGKLTTPKMKYKVHTNTKPTAASNTSKLFQCTKYAAIKLKAPQK